MKLNALSTKRKAAAVGTKKSKLDHAVPDSEVNLQDMIFLDVIEI